MADLEEETHESVSELLEALVKSSTSSVRLPVKFLLTSRPETRIRETSVSDEDFSRILRLHAVNRDEVSADIRRYITETLDIKLSSRPSIRARFTRSTIEDLVGISDCLFIVAATVLKHTIGAGADAAEARFKKLLNASRDGLNTKVAGPLDRMYGIILDDAVRDHEHDATELSSLLRLIASLLSARMTLSVAALAQLLDLELCDVRESLSHLHAVVDVPEGDRVPGLRTLHASFADYLFSRAPNHIRIPRLLGHETLAHGCFNVMENRLYFNISCSRSSYGPNRSAKLKSIALSLEYACLYWAHHVGFFKPNHEVGCNLPSFDSKIGHIFRPRLLAWLEVLSVLHRVGLAYSLLLSAASVVSWLSY